MMIGISRIEIEGFRGITGACVLPLEGKSLLLFGENGTGKSSFVDALERLFTGEVSILEGRMGVSTERHGPNIRAIGRPRICVRFTDGSEYTLEGNAELLTPRARSYLAPAQEPLYILRRRQILEFIESRPQERYDQLRPFLRLKEAEEREAALRTASQRAAQKSGDAQRILKASSRDLAESVGIHEYQVPLSEQQICAPISGRLQQTVETLAPMLSRISDVPDVISAVDSELSRFGDTQMVMAVHTVLSRLRDLDSALRPVDLASFHSVLEGLRQREARIARTFFEDVLQRGLEWVEADWQGMCPLCETPWEKDELTVRIHARLNDMREIVRSRQEADRLRRDLLNSVRKAVDSARLARTDIEALGDEDDLRLTDSLLESLGHHRNLLERRLDQITLEALNVAIDSWQIASYGTRLEETIERINRQAARLPSTSELRPFIELRTILGRVTELWMKQGAALRQRDLTYRRAEIAATMLRLAEEARREEVQELFDAISEDINALYVRLHPDEDHGNIHLEVREEVRASVNLRAKFFDRMNEDPWGYYSDAHLDSLGLCTFLALRRWYRKLYPDLNLLVLDDVLTSVDAPHAVRTAELILREFADYQILLTTHDRIWYEHLRDIQARCRVKGQFLNKVIHRWTLEEGPDLREPEEERDRLIHLLSEGGASEIASEGGRLLEHILQEMRYSLRLSVQAKRGELYEIGEIWPVFYSTLRKGYPGFYDPCGSTLDDLDVRWPIRNWVGAHFNIWASRVSRAEVVEFGKTVEKLFDCVFCRQCRRFIEPSMAPAGQLSCRCGNLIYPARGKEAVEPRQTEELIETTRGAFQDARLDTDLYFDWKRTEQDQENN